MLKRPRSLQFSTIYCCFNGAHFILLFRGNVLCFELLSIVQVAAILSSDVLYPQTLTCMDRQWRNQGWALSKFHPPLVSTYFRLEFFLHSVHLKV